MKLLLVDDHALFRTGMDLLLHHLHPEMDVLHASSVVEALATIRREPAIDLVLLDLHMPGMTGLDALLHMRQHETPPIVVLSGSEDLQVVWKAIDAGAMGFIQKQSDAETLRAALSVVLNGGITIPQVCLTETGRRAAHARDLTPKQRMQELGVSERQMQVLAKLAYGKPNKVIARELGISEATVKTHLSAVFDALKVSNRTQAVFALARLEIGPQELEA
ncbi:response regulator [Ramlibacter pallidus]|uniref:Response regulator transcription factor n=1 Tax=Ramlibacter pallidus TaxID=2780087 RepID=A0ABR9S4T3_9BURK|nr:response regulator transcription factor [Ramlibacter pallidus]MBE7368520.1 response regulator transcription factor [Ramlibacter pallidus]